MSEESTEILINKMLDCMEEFTIADSLNASCNVILGLAYLIDNAELNKLVAMDLRGLADEVEAIKCGVSNE